MVGGDRHRQARLRLRPVAVVARAGAARFVRSAPVDALGYSLVAVAVLPIHGSLAAIAADSAGWLLAAHFDGDVTALIDARLADRFPPTAAVSFATNDWSVAISSAFAGLAHAVPAAVSLLFNGAVLGVYGWLEAAPLALLASVTPTAPWSCRSS